MESLYPAAPSASPAALTQPSAGYLARVVLVLVGLVAFVAIYVGIGVAVALALRELWSIEIHERASFYIVFGGTIVLGALLAFLVKGLFFRERAAMDGFIEVTAREQPKLFAFIDALVRDTGAPRPKKVYVTADVNAMVFYEPSLLSLILPTGKSLVIGLGLVNHLTLSELKAVLGHELGHFSQRAMKVGAYVYTAQRVVANLVYGRDAFDDLLEEGKRSDGRIAALAYVVAAILWVVRTVLRLAFEVVALGHRALGREMELAADRMAVSVAGGDSIARGLFKAEVADTCFAVALGRLVHAADQGLVTDDFFFHQERALDEVRARAKQPAFGDPTVRIGGFLFASDGTSKPSMWATHPPSSERERAARAHGVEATHDERPAWLLFDGTASLRARATVALMRQRIPHASALPKPASEVQAILDRERSETEIVHRAGEMYTGRLLARLDLDELFARTPRPRAELEAAHAALYGADVEALNAQWKDVQQSLELLARARAGQLVPGALVLDGVRHTQADVPELFAARIESLQKIDRRFEAVDARVAHVHAEMAIELGEKASKRLRRAYADVLRHGRWLAMMRAAQESAGPLLNRLQGGGQLDESSGHTFVLRIEEIRTATLRLLVQTRDRKAPKLLGLAPDARLGAFLLPRAPAPRMEDSAGPGPWITRVLADSAEVIDKLERLHQRAIATLLHRHDEIHAAWSRGEAIDVAGAAPTDDLDDVAADAADG